MTERAWDGGGTYTSTDEGRTQSVQYLAESSQKTSCGPGARQFCSGKASRQWRPTTTNSRVAPYVAVRIEHEVGVGGFAQVCGTLGEPFDVASGGAPHRLGIFGHQELAQLLVGAREGEEVHGVEVPEDLHVLW